MLDKEGFNSEIDVGVTYASLMSAVSLFFTGILIAQYKSFSSSIKVPIVFLIISTFSFIFAATIYSNAGAEVTLNKLKTVEKYMIYAKNIVELLGLYLFILATPLVIGAVTRDDFLRTTTIIVALVGFALYSQSKFSVLEKELTGHKKRYLSSIILLLAILLYISQPTGANSSLFAYSFVSVLLLIVLLLCTALFSYRSKQYKPILVRMYVNSDADILSKIILKNLDKVKLANYSKEIIDDVREQSTPEAIRKIANDKTIFVAEFNNRIVGLAYFSANKIDSVFSDPSLHKKGIGRILVEKIEAELTKHGFKEIQAVSNASDRAFYVRLGYTESKTPNNRDKGTDVIMLKSTQYDI